MEPILNAAVIGCGRMGAFTSESVLRHSPSCWLPLSHAEAISAHPRLKLTALCDREPATLLRAAEKFGADRVYENPHDLLETEKPQVLGIATRTLGRAGLIQAAVAAGTKAIHLEKPLCNSVAELHALRDLFRSTDVYLTWGAIRRFFAVYRQALALAESGRYGALREVRVSLGSAPLYWTHSHSIDLLLFAASGRSVSGVQARLDNIIVDKGTMRIDSDPLVLTASVYFEDGLIGHITQALGSDFTLSCEHAEITVRADGASLDIYSAGENAYPAFGQLVVENGGQPTGTLAAISHLVQCLDGHSASTMTNARIKRDILNAQSIAFAMVQSHLERSRIVDVSEIEPSMVILARTGGRYA